MGIEFTSELIGMADDDLYVKAVNEDFEIEFLLDENGYLTMYDFQYPVQDCEFERLLLFMDELILGLDRYMETNVCVRPEYKDVVATYIARKKRESSGVIDMTDSEVELDDKEGMTDYQLALSASEDELVVEEELTLRKV